MVTFSANFNYVCIFGRKIWIKQMSYEATKTHILDQPNSFHLPQPKELKTLKTRFLILAWEDFIRTLLWFPGSTFIFVLTFTHIHGRSQEDPWMGTVGNISGKSHNWNVPFRISVKICRILLIAGMPSRSPALPVWSNARELRQFARDLIIEMMPAVKSGRYPTPSPCETRTLKE